MPLNEHDAANFLSVQLIEFERRSAARIRTQISCECVSATYEDLMSGVIGYLGDSRITSPLFPLSAILICQLAVSDVLAASGGIFCCFSVSPPFSYCLWPVDSPGEL